MRKNSLNSFGVRLKRNQMKMILGGNGNTSCKATCNDGSLVGVSGCSDQALACSKNEGAKSCACNYPGPFDPPPVFE